MVRVGHETDTNGKQTYPIELVGLSMKTDKQINKQTNKQTIPEAGKAK